MFACSRPEPLPANPRTALGRYAEVSDHFDRKSKPVNAVPAQESRVSWWMLLAVLVYAPAILFVDSRLSAAWPWEYVLGALTLLVLALWTTRLSRADRLQVWICVVVATGWEYLGSQIWQGYRYKFGGIPTFVPFGHGLVYVFAFSLAATAIVRRYERRFAWTVLGLAWAWAVAGVTVLPAFTGRVDWHGWYWLPLFTAAILFGPRKALFAGIFIAVTDLEIAGTWFGAWTWLPNTPWAHVTSGNPPSAIAGGYAVIDGSVLLVVALLTRAISLGGSFSASPAPFAGGARRASARR